MRRLCATALLLVCGLCCAFAAEKSPTIVAINGSKFYVHVVQPGETLYALSKAYAVGESVILEHNPSATSGLRSGETIKIPYLANVTEPQSEKKIRKTFDIHNVVKGETLYAISRQFEIPIQTIIEDNPRIDPIHLRLGEPVLIRKKGIGSEDEMGSKTQWEQYREQLNSVAEPGVEYHIVQPGETFYSLSRRFGITEAELGQLNGALKPADLKAGAIIKGPAKAGAATAPQVPTAVAQAVVVPESPVLSQEPPHTGEIEFRALRAGEPLRVALLLPMAAAGTTADNNYLEFYQGFLLGLDSVKVKLGHSVKVDLYNTSRDPGKIRQITQSEAFKGTNLIIGPVYEEGLTPVIQYAEQEGIPVVSPLANVVSTNSDALFQLFPDPTTKYQKVANLINGDKHITLIYTSSVDTEFEREIRTLLGDSEYDKYTYKYEHPNQRRGGSSPSDLTSLLENDRDNVFVILANNEVDVERVLAALASADTNLISRGRTTPRYVVLGNARWNRYNNIDRTMFFKNRVIFLSTYHAKRDSQAIVNFDSAYIRAFGMLPTLYSYRGYDAAMLFCPAMYNDIEYDLEGRQYTPLQTTYLFGQDGTRLNHINRNWMRVNYNSDFTITIE